MPRPYTAALREMVLADVAMRDLSPYSKYSPKNNDSLASIARRYNISESTIRRWIKKEKDDCARLYGQQILKKPKPRGRPPKLSPAETKILIDYVARSRAMWEPVTISVVRQYAAFKIGKSVSPSYVSRMLRKAGYTSQRSTKRPAARVRPTYDAEVSQFRAKWAVHPLLSHMFIVMDESGVWNDSPVSRTYSKVGSGSAGVKSADKASRDTVVATIRMDGKKLPLMYIEHQRQKTKNKQVVQRAIKGMTEEIMLDYIEEVLAPNTVPGQYLLMDQLSSHKTARVRAKLESIGLKVIYFPPKTVPDLSACDNFFFSLFKRAFRAKDRSTAEKKKLAAFEAYAEVPAHAVRACWRRCQLVNEALPVDLTLLP
jgi:transposase